MGRKNQLAPKVIHAAQALNANFNSDPSKMTGVDKIQYLMTYSGLVGTGEFKLQSGARDPRDAANTIRWADLDVDPIAIDGSVAAADTAQYNVSAAFAGEQIRLVYTKGTASAGTVEVMVYLSTVGA